MNRQGNAHSVPSIKAVERRGSLSYSSRMPTATRRSGDRSVYAVYRLR